eukprot:jgi/Chrzof1/2356/Cz11g12040.t1
MLAFHSTPYRAFSTRPVVEWSTDVVDWCIFNLGGRRGLNPGHPGGLVTPRPSGVIVFVQLLSPSRV